MRPPAASRARQFCGIKWTKPRMLLGLVLFGITANVLLSNKARVIREGFVAAHYHFYRITGSSYDATDGAVYTKPDGLMSGFTTELSKEDRDAGKRLCIVDIGANDCVWHSQSAHLIRRWNYTGILFEPDPVYGQKCADLHKDDGDRVIIVPNGLSDHEGVEVMRKFSMGFENSFNPDKKHQYDAETEQKSMMYVLNSNIVCKLIEQLKCSSDSMMSIDVEGYEQVVMKNIDCSERFKYIVSEQRELPGDWPFDNIGSVVYNTVFKRKSDHVIKGEKGKKGKKGKMKSTLKRR
eukprot:TRINITY_DN2193_c1_g1_i1.p1 TRINITY_DN2193_c1_g1~~TRINITY_DN2193_c1_g1_i1.p1  ORF type:complete len:293 (-),score=59.84 TRINITY_DN2193_c1_g1_i1:15-893(-)